MSDSARPEGAKDKPDPDEFGRSLGPGIGVNLLVTDVTASAAYQSEVLGADGTHT